MNIRPATLNDVPALLEIERGAPTAAHWSEAEYRALLQPSGHFQCVLLVAEKDGRVAGFLAAKCIAEWCEIENIVVKAERQRRGTARSLMEHFLDSVRQQGARQVLLEVRSANRAARELYENCNFEATGNRRAYYHMDEKSR